MREQCQFHCNLFAFFLLFFCFVLLWLTLIIPLVLICSTVQKLETVYTLLNPGITGTISFQKPKPNPLLHLRSSLATAILVYSLVTTLTIHWSQNHSSLVSLKNSSVSSNWSCGLLPVLCPQPHPATTLPALQQLHWLLAKFQINLECLLFCRSTMGSRAFSHFAPRTLELSSAAQLQLPLSPPF